jgi:hypothetical protein
MSVEVTAMTEPAQIRALIRRLEEAMNTRRLDLLDGIVAEQPDDHRPARAAAGPDAIAGGRPSSSMRR